MKAVSKSHFQEDPKVKENLEREIRILKLLRNCEHVVHLEHVEVRDCHAISQISSVSWWLSPPFSLQSHTNLSLTSVCRVIRPFSLVCRTSSST